MPLLRQKLRARLGCRFGWGFPVQRIHAASFLAYCLLASAASAEGYTSLDGRLADGRMVSLDPESKRIHVSRLTEDGGVVDAEDFPADDCVFSSVFGESVDDFRLLTCLAGGKSPLAGAQYIGRTHNGSCDDGDPEMVYHCIHGCGQGSIAPKRLEKGYWEC